MRKLKVAILGSGNIGTDLLVKIMRSPLLECSLFIGRNMASPGMAKANSLGVRISDLSIEAIVKEPDCCDLVFDATSAKDHIHHWSLLERLGKIVIDMTPAKIGEMCIPAVNIEKCNLYKNVNMVSCGGQASIPLAYLVGRIHQSVEYIEVVSSIASRSAGPATRANIDEYIETTEEGIKNFSGCNRAKAILILNPAQPCIDMQTTIFARVKNPDLDKLKTVVDEMVNSIRMYVPGYQLIVPPMLENDRIIMTVKVQGLGDYLPTYAGNLDIINCAAIATAEKYAKEYIKISSYDDNCDAVEEPYVNCID
ncbi:acetaldehyde dehydrogenase (acetylating) [Limnothrix sp. FACHB-708]|uniref:acetaldehyde dehydrogenase (acetylating) n=1 Tax=unclassified Limnothrix TaxID=2632864 RepID=UPI0016852869|nr:MULTISPECIES: acetaldehyde dehydrogenase (acetylating) [unclassified Limnothrix]MBD2552238.1 acetaldehyde dehydrogenase (acetylating) [Limnothrix sp. FACHB-708]MBD2592102.1 acetaldehyde dehydrogenase (acetylating) [Limnothrix sp. FACHB-406]